MIPNAAKRKNSLVAYQSKQIIKMTEFLLSAHQKIWKPQSFGSFGQPHGIYNLLLEALAVFGSSPAQVIRQAATTVAVLVPSAHKKPYFLELTP